MLADVIVVECVCVGWARVWTGVVRPGPPVRNFVSPRRLFFTDLKRVVEQIRGFLVFILIAINERQNVEHRRNVRMVVAGSLL